MESSSAFYSGQCKSCFCEMVQDCASLCDGIGSSRGNVDVELRQECARACMLEIKWQQVVGGRTDEACSVYWEYS
jgi:hypothetical protein